MKARQSSFPYPRTNYHGTRQGVLQLEHGLPGHPCQVPCELVRGQQIARLDLFFRLQDTAVQLPRPQTRVPASSPAFLKGEAAVEILPKEGAPLFSMEPSLGLKGNSQTAVCPAFQSSKLVPLRAWTPTHIQVKEFYRIP